MLPIKPFMQWPWPAAAEAEHHSAWRPPADVYRGRQGWLIKLELAGVRQEDIQVSARGSCITIAGVRRDSSIYEDQTSYSMEISYNRFERTIELPCDLEQADIQADYCDVMLLVRICLEGNG